jgi:hypothetical protein
LGVLRWLPILIFRCLKSLLAKGFRYFEAFLNKNGYSPCLRELQKLDESHAGQAFKANLMGHIETWKLILGFLNSVAETFD